MPVTFLDPHFQQTYRTLLPAVMTGTIVRWEERLDMGWSAEIAPHRIPGDWRPPNRIRVGGEGRVPDACRDYDNVRFQLLAAYEVRYPEPPNTFYDVLYMGRPSVVDGEWGLVEDFEYLTPNQKSQRSKEEGDG